MIQNILPQYYKEKMIQFVDNYYTFKKGRLQSTLSGEYNKDYCYYDLVFYLFNIINYSKNTNEVRDANELLRELNELRKNDIISPSNNIKNKIQESVEMLKRDIENTPRYKVKIVYQGEKPFWVIIDITAIHPIVMSPDPYHREYYFNLVGGFNENDISEINSIYRHFSNIKDLREKFIENKS